jgi:dipeptidyl aminopeptidase/acylaminoacyl peptidase
MSSCPLVGQVSHKKQLTEEEYDKWGTLGIKALSDNGKWTSYEMTYKNQNDTLFLQSTNTKMSFSFPRGRDSRFAGEKLFAYMVGDELRIYNLINHKNVIIKDVLSYDLNAGQKCIITLHKGNVLQVHNINGKMMERMEHINEYKINNDCTALVFTYKSGNEYVVESIKLSHYKHTVLSRSNTLFSRFTWQENGNTVAFANGSFLYYYQFDTNRLLSLDIAKEDGNDLIEIAKGNLNPITIADDGKKVFFSITKTSAGIPKKNEEKVEVWNGNDACLYPAQQALETSPIPKLTVWFPLENSYKVLSDEIEFRARLNVTNDYVILSNPYSYGLQTKYYEEVDYYIKNVHTGTKKLFLKQQSHDPNQLCFSPTTNLIVYYRDKNWWLYNPEKDTTVNLTKRIETIWDNSDEVPHQFRIYGCAGWTADGKSILIYDAYDIWKVSLDGFRAVRLTRGKEEQKIYRISKMEYEKIKLRGYETGGLRALFDLQKNSMLEVVNTLDWSMGYVTYSSGTGLKIVAYDDMYFSGIKKSKNNCYLYSSQTFSQPPQIEFSNSAKSKSKTLFKSNKQHAEYFCGKSKLIHYSNSEEKKLKGALFFPAAFDASKTYPMIVSIYDQQSKKLHHYSNPTLSSEDGFAISNYTSRGYFVLLPDITYTLGAPGLSALDCVTAAVKTVVANENVDPKKIGLIGHSFGGYETDFIITQTDIFATAVSGAGMSNIIGRYFEIGKSITGQSEMWRFENQQFRMGSSYFRNKQAYWKNNPINESDNVKTPLLQWAGKKDRVIPYEQSVSFYLALRRLGIPTILLIYPDEVHSIEKTENQKDLSLRIAQWFDFYLKDKKDIRWINAGTIIQK